MLRLSRQRLCVHAFSGCALLGLGGPLALGQLVLDDVGAAAGVDALGFGRGAAMVDLDGDGLLDLVAVSGGGQDLFFRQRVDHTFEDVTLAWGMPVSDAQSWDVLATDFDNDGDPDVFISGGAFFLPEPNVLLRNDLSTLGTFTDVSASAGDIVASTSVFGATALDFDRDGLLDVFTCDSRWTSAGGSAHLFRNEGGLFFREVTQQAGMDVDGMFRHCSAGDFDNDGWPDIAVSNNSQGPNYLFRNDGDGTFTDVAQQAGVALSGQAFGMVLEDFDNDGWLDIYLARYQLQPSLPSGLFRNDGDGTFTDLSLSSGITGQADMGHNTGDLDADGAPEIFIGTGSPTTPFLDLLLRVGPDGTGGFMVTDVSESSGVRGTGPSRSHGSVFGDYDDDGDVDLYLNRGGASNVPAGIERNVLLNNRGNANGWVALDLRGVVSNRSAVGARSVATTPAGRQVHRHLTAGKGFGNTDSPTQHFGLGAEDSVERIDVTWPSGIVQTLLAPDARSRHALVETGIQPASTRPIQGVVTLGLCGPPGHVATVMISPHAVELIRPKMGGIQRVAPPFVGVVSAMLDASGRGTVQWVVAGNSAPADGAYYAQSWTRAPGAIGGGTLTNVATIEVAP